jgi:hypothetical protein
VFIYNLRSLIRFGHDKEPGRSRTVSFAEIVIFAYSQEQKFRNKLTHTIHRSYVAPFDLQIVATMDYGTTRITRWMVMVRNT